jgi:hypothetical protein
MMRFVRETSPDTFELIDAEAPIVINNVTWPVAILTSWSVEDLAVAHIYSVTTPFAPPLGYKVTGAPTYQRDGDQIIETYETIVDASAVPTSISRRQLILALWKLGFISAGEALAAANSSSIPAMIKTSFDALSEPDRTEAYITFASMSICNRHDPIVTGIASANSISDGQMDQWFIFASTL